MELGQEEFMGSNDLTQIIKGKRTKRQRSSSPHKVVRTVSSSSSSGCGEERERERERIDYGSISSHTSCSEVYESTEEEEEDMANCLILLAQGDAPRARMEKLSSRKLSRVSTSTTTTTTTTTTNKAGFYVYECKTCNRSFPSFQALGGHRASHKKPKHEDKKAPQPTSMVNDHHDEYCQLNKSSTSSPDHPLSLQISTINNKGNFLGINNINIKAKIHECSICGSEFTSGQALGGHMRRHRANTVNINNNNNQVAVISASSDDQIIKPRTILSLDLNLPAPEDDHHHRESKFQFASPVFSAAPTLVDCYY